ncbi:hypothetical protein [Kitasatospora sp. NPDC005751]|uniref:hypothetical protein n=1 Tax=Kitasatospora sp. NPDC005751 TaxID=3157064 RepID=UPI0033E0CD86
METAELESKVHGLETALAVQEANMAGAHSGTWSVMAVGAGALIVGIFLGMAIAKS